MPQRRTLYSLCGADGARHYSPHVWKIIMAMKHKGLDFELAPVSFQGIGQIEDGSFKSVPVLNDRGHLEGDSFGIAAYLDKAYPDRPALFGGEGGVAVSRFIECFCQNVLHPPLQIITMMAMHALMSPEDQAHFRAAREKRFGSTMEEAHARKDAELATLPQKLEPVRSVLSAQPWLGGDRPLFADYILFGTFQWARVCMPTDLLGDDPKIRDWFERCLDLHGATGRKAAVSSPVAADDAQADLALAS